MSTIWPSRLAVVVTALTAVIQTDSYGQSLTRISEPLGRFIAPHAVSADGRALAGNYTDPEKFQLACRWTAEEGRLVLGALPR
jgi:hypothetical protein